MIGHVRRDADAPVKRCDRISLPDGRISSLPDGRISRGRLEKILGEVII